MGPGRKKAPPGPWAGQQKSFAYAAVSVGARSKRHADYSRKPGITDQEPGPKREPGSLRSFEWGSSGGCPCRTPALVRHVLPPQGPPGRVAALVHLTVRETNLIQSRSDQRNQGWRAGQLEKFEREYEVSGHVLSFPAEQPNKRVMVELLRPNRTRGI